MARCDLCFKFDDCPFRYDIDSYCCAFERKPMTNGDKIRAMTDEELARELYDVSWKVAIYSSEIDTEEDWLDWLKQEAKDEH